MALVDPNEKLSTNFTLGELIFTTVKNANNIPDFDDVNNLRSLCQKVLQPVRDKFGVVIVNSGFRNLKVNESCMGSPTSSHLFGQAADIVFKKKDLIVDAFKYIYNELKYDQLIWEKGTIKEPEWIHVSYREKSNRQVCLRTTMKNGYEEYIRFVPE